MCVKGKMQYIAVLISAINMTSFGMAYGWTSPSLPQVIQYYSFDRYQGSWISVIIFPAAIIGAPLSAFFTNKYGRKKLLLLSALPMILSWLIIGLDQSLIGLLLGRFFGGFAGAILFTVLPTYIAEVTEPNRRGKCAGIITWSLNFGVVIMYASGPFLSIPQMAFTSLSLPILFVVTFIWMPESPYFYMMKGRRKDAEQVLVRLQENDVEEKLVEIEEEDIVIGNIFDIFRTRVNRKILLYMIILITIEECSGRVPFMMYCQIIFFQASRNIPYIYVTMIYGATQFISSLFASFIVDKFGRIPLLLISCTGTTICLLAQGTFFFYKFYLEKDTEPFKYVPAVILFSFVIMFNIGLGIVPMIMAGEVFATNVKSYGLCILDLWCSIISIGIGKFFQVSSDDFGVYVPFWAYAFTSALGIIFIAKFLPETKGLSLQQIQKNLRNSL